MDNDIDNDNDNDKDKDKDKYILSFDPALSCGWCISCINEDNELHIIEYGYIQTEQQEYSGDMCLSLQKEARKLFDKYDIDEVVMEDYMFSKSKCQGAHMNVFLRCALMMLCRSLDKPYWVMSVSNWKSIIAGRSTPTREFIKYYGKSAANKIFIQEALWVRYAIRFPNHSYSHKTGKPIALRYDIIDACGINIAHAYSVHNVKLVYNDVELLPDIEMKGIKKGYSYVNL